MKKTKAIFILLFLVLIALVFYLKQLNTGSYQSIETQNSCVSCHTDMTGFSPAHSPDKVQCNDCHLGNTNSFDKYEAHRDMVLIPGNLSNASKTCAKCHQGIDYRINKSMMNTMSGIISVDKYIYGENNNLDSIFNIHHLKNKSLADNHLRNKCASCHLGNEKLHANPITEKSRGGGCTACHLNYSKHGKTAHNQYINSNKDVLPKIHPSLSLKITDNHCFGCHSRSGRISTNYEGWHETIYKDTLYGESKYRVLDDKRVFEKQSADIHHTKGLSCIDCHDSYDVMGDGKTYAHQENAVHTKCDDCHSASSKKITDLKTISLENLRADEQRMIQLRHLNEVKAFVYGEHSNKNLINVVLTDNHLELITKNTGKHIVISKQSEQCAKEVHSNLKCSTCHTSWAPQCISCHTEFDKDMEGYDLLDKKWTEGKWLEKGNHYLAEFPSLGIVNKDGKKTIKTFSPGMIMHLKKQDTTTFHRVFAPVSAHTISQKGTTCKACHNNPVALGYGRGELQYKNKAWSFKPQFPNEEDGLPQDAWIGFLTNDTINKATRIHARPFTLIEQQKILKVGTCLTCHNENSKVIALILDDYPKALQMRKDPCH